MTRISDYLTILTEKNIRQLVLVKSFSQLPFAVIELYQYFDGGWQQLAKEFPAVIGKNGISGSKKEGDYMTPIGLFALSLVYGYESVENVLSQMPYRQITSEDKYIDDKNHADYNTWVIGETTAASYEIMLRADGLYRLGVVIDYNINPIIKGSGSAIFLHIWRSSNIGTEGCIATSYANLKLIVAFLNSELNPHILIVGEDNKNIGSNKSDRL